MKNVKTLNLLKEINKNSRNWRDEHFNDIKQIFKGFQKQNDSLFLLNLTPKISDFKAIKNDPISSKEHKRNASNPDLIDKFHIDEKLQNLNNRIQKIFENNQESFRNLQKNQLFSLKKRELIEKDKTTFSQSPSSFILCKKILNDLNLKKKDKVRKILTNCHKINETENQIQTERISKQKKTSWHIDEKFHQKVTNISALKKIFN